MVANDNGHEDAESLDAIMPFLKFKTLRHVIVSRSTVRESPGEIFSQNPYHMSLIFASSQIPTSIQKH